MNNKELKPCPFCGGDAEIHKCQSGDNDSIYYRVACANEKCSMGNPDAWYENKIELVKDWNTRHTPEQRS